jgi:AcrR family transcriptional regulator
VSRTVDETRPIELLDAIVAYLVKHGIAEVSLRPLAKAVGSSPRVLLYYFGSKEKMLAQAIRRLRERQRSSFGKLRDAQYENPSDACRAIWREMSTPGALAVFQLSLETFTLALRHRRQFARFLSNSVEDWLQFMSQPLIRQGATPADARAYATIVIAGFRGFLLDSCATRDSKRINQAVEMWIATLNPLASTLIPVNAHGPRAAVPARTQSRGVNERDRSAGVPPAVAGASSLPHPSPRKPEV